MNTFKRIIVSMKSCIDHVADDFENHEALADEAIKEVQDLISKTRWHLHRVQKMAEQHHKNQQEQQEQADLWTERAIRVNNEAPQKALQCVKRHREAQQQAKIVSQHYQQCLAQQEKVQNDLTHLQNTLQELKNKKTLFAARHNRTGIQNQLGTTGLDILTEVNGVFERWESRLASQEIDVPDMALQDELATEFAKEEDEKELQQLLQTLVKQNIAQDNQGGSHEC